MENIEKMENKENAPPPPPKGSTSKIPKRAAFPVPVLSAENAREPLSPKKGAKVNSKYTPAYMLPTASSTKKKQNFSAKRVLGKHYVLTFRETNILKINIESLF